MPDAPQRAPYRTVPEACASVRSCGKIPLLIGARREEAAAGHFFPCGPVPVPDRVRWRAKRSAAPRGCPPSPWESPPGLSRPDSPKPHGPRGHEGGQRGRVESRWVKRWLAGGLRGGWSEPWAGWEGVTPVGHAVNVKWAPLTAWLVERGGGLWLEEVESWKCFQKLSGFLYGPNTF